MMVRNMIIACRIVVLGAAMSVLAGCAAVPTAPPPAVLTSCDVVPGELWAAGELPDGLPAEPGDAVLSLYRAWSEARAALATVRAIVEQ